MVIARNEWLNNYEDEQKSAPANTTAATTNTNTSVNYVPATSTSSTTASTIRCTTATTAAIQIPSSVSESVLSPSQQPSFEDYYINIIKSSNSIAQTHQQQQQQQHHQQYQQSKSYHRRRQQQDQQQQAQQKVSVIVIQKNMMEDTLKLDHETAEVIENNNTDLDLLHSSPSTTSIQTLFANSSPSNFTSNNTTTPISITITSNTNAGSSSSSITTTTTTATSSNQYEPYNSAAISQNVHMNSVITPQVLSRALQTALNAGQNNNLMCSLSSIGINPCNTLQYSSKLAKQLGSSIAEPETAIANSSQDGDNMRDHHHQQQMLTPSNGQAKIVLHCEPNSHPFQTRIIHLTTNVECKVGRLIAKSKAAETNAIFDCKVLSRNHAVLWYSNDGKFWVKDTKSSNGTFINESKLGMEAAELHYGDVVKFGVDVMENSRKEVHGCIIAGVKLYLPDGRETISIESESNQLSPHSGEGRISFDEMHRLNLFMQEAAQREKALKLKLYNLQNILDATRKNSALCWQAMITEDQLLHRIGTLEKKLQIMEKNVPESVLRNEVLKLLDDKSSYQHLAKEALRKVYQERCDAMQLLSKMEAAFTASDDECKILRDEIMNTKLSLQDVNARLLCLEKEYSEFKEESDCKQQEDKEQFEQRSIELMEKYEHSRKECTELRTKISELLAKRDELFDEEQQQAIDRLDAVIVGMDLDDDDDDYYEDECKRSAENRHNDKEIKAAKAAPTRKEAGGGAGNKAMIIDIINGDERNESDTSESETETSENENETFQKVTKKLNPSASLINLQAAEATTTMDNNLMGKKSTILKWLENSDINQKEGFSDIFDAMCNESESSEGSGSGAGTKAAEATNADVCLENNDENNDKTDDTSQNKDFTLNFVNFCRKLNDVQQNLSKLENKITIEMDKTMKVVATSLADNISEAISPHDDDSDAKGDIADVAEGDNVKGSHDDKIDDELKAQVDVKEKDDIEGQQKGAVLSDLLMGNDESYMLLKSSVSMLRDAYNEICVNMTNQQALLSAGPAMAPLPNKAQSKIDQNAANVLPPFGMPHDDKLDVGESLQLAAADHEAAHKTDSDDGDRDELASFAQPPMAAGVEAADPISSCNSKDRNSKSFAKNKHLPQTHQLKIDVAIKDYQNQVTALNEKLCLIEIDNQNNLELMQLECDEFKEKAIEMTKLVQTLRDEKEALQRVINENNSNILKTAAACFDNDDLAAAIGISEELKSLPSSTEDQNTQTSVEETCRKEQSNQTCKQLDAAQSAADFEEQLQEEIGAINNADMQREEDLVFYKERLEQSQNDYLRLQQEMIDLKLTANDPTMNFVKSVMPYGVILLAVLIYFIFGYL